MNGKKLFEAFGQVEDQYLDLVDSPRQRKTVRFSPRRLMAAAAVAAICASVLTMTAMAAGWIPNIFARAQEKYPEYSEMFQEAAQAAQDQEPETVVLPVPDLTKITLFERYYDGEKILLGYDLSKAIPEPVVGYPVSGELMEKFTRTPGNYALAYYPDGDDTMDHLLETGILTQEDYDAMMDGRSEKAKEHDIRSHSALMLEDRLRQELTPEQYDALWKELEEKGSCCVADQSKLFIGDHQYVNGHDMIETLDQQTGSNGVWEFPTEEGDCIRLEPLPEAGRNQEQVTVTLVIKGGIDYWYLQLDGPAYHVYEQTLRENVDFVLENVTMPASPGNAR